MDSWCHVLRQSVTIVGTCDEVLQLVTAKNQTTKETKLPFSDVPLVTLLHLSGIRHPTQGQTMTLA